ncbi:SUMF1/EgtB/PvdO family nonheme iron enzyme [Bradyrhizobium sp. Pa8]|uniref:SUMF1/EgtB/PvdO family nonheme iron enzyme n=1 Tax=Bradyrhizobium sp. Pa8 TaxID=3386552 RepID=UPI00403F68CC
MNLADTKSLSGSGQSFEDPAGEGMPYVPGGTFRMGSDRHYPEEAPAYLVTVDEFWMDRAPVTNRQFRKFLNATGYVTVAEITPDAKDYPGALPHTLMAGSLVFTPPKRALAAGGGLDGAEFAWGDKQFPGARHMANSWQGTFPHQNPAADGFERTSPVTAFPANGYGLHDMIGNVWERTADWYSQKHEADIPKVCCIPQNPRGGPNGASYDSCQPTLGIPRKVLEGGSHLCAPNYCRRYRPAARHAEPIDTSASHLGFRCITRKRITS